MSESLKHDAHLPTVPPAPRVPVRKLALAMLGLAVVVVALLSSYSSAFGNPSARHIPVAVAAPPAVLRELEASPMLRVYPVPGLARARSMVEDRIAYGAFLLPRTGTAIVLVANGGGPSVATILTRLGQQVAQTRGVPLIVTDLAPTSPNDPNGTVEFYCVVFLMLGGALGATMLGRIAGPVRRLPDPLRRLALVVMYAVLLSAVVTMSADFAFGALVGHFGLLFLTMWLYALAVCLAVAGLAEVARLPAPILLILVLIGLGNPSAGGPVPRPLLNSFYSDLNQVMPQGAALSALRGVQYFGDRGIGPGLVCLIIWAAAGLIVLLGAAVVREVRAAVAVAR